MPCVEMAWPWTIGEKHLIVKNRGDRRPQLYVMNSKGYDLAEALRQINDIDAGMVIAAANWLLKLSGPENS